MSATPPGLTFALHVEAEVGAPVEFSGVDGARRRMIPILGGMFEGEGVSGEVLPGGADWQRIGAAGESDLVARYMLRAADGTAIAVVNRALRVGPPAVLARIAAGEQVDPADYYFRATPRFEVAPGPHRWLAEHMFVGVGQRQANRVILDIFRVD